MDSRAFAKRRRFFIGKSESESGGKLSGTFFFLPLRLQFSLVLSHLYLAIFAAPTPRARLFVRPSRRHMESVEEFTVEVAK
jgi:hypothetical protein